MILLLIGLLMGLTALVLVIYPLLGLDRTTGVGQVPSAGGQERQPGAVGDMTERESAARQALLDVDFDYHLGNLDEEDYTQLRDRYEERALVALKARYERERELDALIEKQLVALKARDRQGTASARRPAGTTAVAEPRTVTPPAGGMTAAQRRRRRKGVLDAGR
jgi:hypothetical protein